MLLVPVRQYVLPKFFKVAHLQDLDAAEYEEAPAITYNLAFEVGSLFIIIFQLSLTFVFVLFIQMSRPCSFGLIGAGLNLKLKRAKLGYK